MHIEARRFTEYIKRVLPEFFSEKRVLDVGSGDINGNNRFLFTKCNYDGNDVYAAPNVTVVSKTSALTFEPQTFDTIVSTECFEHDPEYKDSFLKIVDMLKPGGLFFFTCASEGRAEHGTRRTTPRDSYGTIGNVSGWTDYYKNLNISDVNASIPLKDTFQQYEAYYNASSKDLYFWGIKRGDGLVNRSVPGYSDRGVSRVAV